MKTQKQLFQHEVRSEKDFAKENMWTLILKMGGPIIILLFVNSIYSLTDSILAAHYVKYGADLNASDIIGQAIPYFSIFFSTIFLTVSGSIVGYSYYLGKGKYRKVKQTVGNGIVTSWIVLVIVMIICALGIFAYLKSMNPTYGINSNVTKMVDDGTNYIYIQTLCLPLFLFNIFYNRIFRVEGKQITAATIPLIGIPINIMLDILFMNNLKTGLVGAGYATLIAEVVIFLIWTGILIFEKQKGSTNIDFHVKNFKLDKHLVTLIFVFGVAALVRRASSSANMLTITSLVSQVKDGSFNGAQFMTVVTRSLIFFNMITLGFSQSAAIVVGFNRAQRNTERVKKAIFVVIIYSIICQLFILAMIFPLTGQMFELFNATASYEMIHSYWIMVVGWIILSMLTIPPIVCSSLKKLKRSLSYIFIVAILTFVPTTAIFTLVVKPRHGIKAAMAFTIVWAVLSTAIVYPSFLYMVKKLNYEKNKPTAFVV